MEQIENDELTALKQFFNRYSKLMLALLIFFLLVLIGGNYWRKNHLAYTREASQIFQEMVMADMHRDPQSTNAKAEQLMTEYTKSPYAQFAGLLLAKIAVNDGDLTRAEAKLRWVMDNGKQNIAQHLATVRLAAILQQQGKLDEALALVAKDPDQAYTVLYAQARGDIYVAKGELQQARDAYTLAMQSLPAGVQSPLLQMKLVDLGETNNA